MADTIVRDSMAVIMMVQYSVVRKEIPRGVNACVMYLVNGRIIAVKESGKGTCIGCSMDPLSFVNMGETCAG